VGVPTTFLQASHHESLQLLPFPACQQNVSPKPPLVRRLERGVADVVCQIGLVHAGVALSAAMMVISALLRLPDRICRPLLLHLLKMDSSWWQSTGPTNRCNSFQVFGQTTSPGSGRPPYHFSTSHVSDRRIVIIVLTNYLMPT
jgi:hypothetical protein